MGSVIDTVIKTENLRTMSVECHGDDIPLKFHDTPLSSYYWYMLANLMFLTLYDTPTEIGLSLLGHSKNYQNELIRVLMEEN